MLLSLFSLSDRLKHKLRIDLIYYWFYSLNIVNLLILRNILLELFMSVSLRISYIRKSIELFGQLPSFLIFSKSSLRLWNISNNPFNLISIAYTMKLSLNHLISPSLPISDKKKDNKSNYTKHKNNKIKYTQGKYFFFRICY